VSAAGGGVAACTCHRSWCRMTEVALATVRKTRADAAVCGCPETNPVYDLRTGPTDSRPLTHERRTNINLGAAAESLDPGPTNRTSRLVSRRGSRRWRTSHLQRTFYP
jgi:hypothetical protein